EPRRAPLRTAGRSADAGRGGRRIPARGAFARAQHRPRAERVGEDDDGAGDRVSPLAPRRGARARVARRLVPDRRRRVDGRDRGGTHALAARRRGRVRAAAPARRDARPLPPLAPRAPRRRGPRSRRGDPPRVRRRLRPGPRGQGRRRPGRALEAARETVHGARKRREELRHGESELACLRRRLEAAQAAARRASGLQLAIEHADAVAEEADARRALDAFPAPMALLRGDEADRLEAIRLKLEDARKDLTAAARDLETAEAARAASGLPDDGVAHETLTALREHTG